MSVSDNVKRFYRGLPIVRELRQIHKAIGALEEQLSRIATKELVEFLEFTLPRTARYGDPKRLLRYGRQTFSQNLEDGMIAEIFQRIDSPLRTFVEIGAGNGLENNTAALLNCGWRGWWIDADPENVRSIAATFRQVIATGQLSVLEAAVTAENIVSQLERLGVPPEFDLLSLDIDRNTYWVWKEMSQAYQTRVAVIEYNASFPPDLDWKIQYRPEAQWNGTAHFGASLKAMELLGRERGYSLIGCDFAGVNAFFVRTDLCGQKFAEPFTAENHYEAPRYGLSARHGHPPAFSDE